MKYLRNVSLVGHTGHFDEIDFASSEWLGRHESSQHQASEHGVPKELEEMLKNRAFFLSVRC